MLVQRLEYIPPKDRVLQCVIKELFSGHSELAVAWQACILGEGMRVGGSL